MAIFTHALDAPVPEECRRGVLTIGNFDGVHLGHQALLSETNCLMRTLDGSGVAVTFDPHPSRILRPDLVAQPLTTMAARCTLLTQQGADHVLILQTSPALLQLSAREFFERIIIEQLQARALVEGSNFGFGRNREGTIETLKSMCAEKNVQLSLVPPCEVLGQPVSSSRVRSELLAGNVDLVTQLLGRTYRLQGTVGVGQKRGATIGFPTANLHEIATLIPGDGVYAVRAQVEGKTWPAAANVGPNPTFGENARKVEVHLIGYRGQLYEQTLAVDFVKKIRATKPFGSAQELVAQIKLDIEDVAAILNS